ncbi:hypothetical protein BH160DRAFT_2893 [Burkholderia sp. H160]|nr:hypothetical protein BH160DRAFT_2893 [Burkholderia sp. H160]
MKRRKWLVITLGVLIGLSAAGGWFASGTSQEPLPLAQCYYDHGFCMRAGSYPLPATFALHP